MFGYVRACKPELKVKEYELYKAVYCSLCRELGKSYGVFARLTLSYDFTFLALLNMSLKDGCDEIERKRCAFNPLKKCNYCKKNENLKMPSAAAMIMIYYKILDNIADEPFFKGLFYRLIFPLFSHAHNKAKKNFPQIEDIVKRFVTAQSVLEKNGCESADKAADPTATALSEIFSLCSEDENGQRVLKRLGYLLGRYIYLLDAACDLSDDIKSNSYNVYKHLYSGDFKAFVKETAEPQLYFCINEAGLAFELLDIKKYKTVLGNIIYLGLEETFKKELNK